MKTQNEKKGLREIKIIRKLIDLFEPKRDIPVRAYFLTAAIPFILFLVAWCILSYGGYVAPFFLPSPTDVIGAVGNLVKSQGLFTHALVSIYRIILGFIIAASVAVPLGILMGSFRIVQALIEPINDFIRYMPVAAFIPLAILWTGTGDIEKMVIIFIGTFFQLILMVADNARIVPAEYLEVAYTLGGSKWVAIFKVLVPAALPGIFNSLRIAMGWAWSYLVVAEIVAANRGLGFLIIQSQRFLKTAEIISGIIIIGIIGIVTDYFFKWLSCRLFPWREQEKV
jgi:NitT/TauT family transport system permease protein